MEVMKTRFKDPQPNGSPWRIPENNNLTVSHKIKCGNYEKNIQENLKGCKECGGFKYKLINEEYEYCYGWRKNNIVEFALIFSPYKQTVRRPSKPVTTFRGIL